ncbi:MAG: NAD(P)-dependent oxidoreductase [Thaumarchaeota archaeon]|nr:NAD(P)-dependent oxidoreductase [Nitrososphaerota archaeon]
MTVLILGGSGFVGSHVALMLAQRGETSILFDLSDPPNTITSANQTLRSKIKFARGDVADLGAILKAAKDNQVTGIINSARLLTGVRECFRANVDGALNTMEVARGLDLKKIVFVSTSAVYRSTVDSSPNTEDTPRHGGAGVYGGTKYMGELMIELYSQQYGLNGLIIRLSRIFGPGQNQVHPIGPLAGAAVVGKELRWKSGADHGLNYSYVKDCAQGIIAAYFAENPKHRAYNIGEGRIVKHSYVIEKLRELIPTADIQIGPGRLEFIGYNHPEGSILDTSRAKADLNYQVQYGFEKGLEEYVAHLKRTPDEAHYMANFIYKTG